MKICFLLFSFIISSHLLNAQTTITPADVVNFQSGATNAFSNNIYRETTNNLFYIGLQSGRLKLLQDSIKTNATLAGSGFNGNVLGIAQQGATTNQILKWNGTNWAPANETTSNNIDSTTANNGLTISGKNLQLGGNLTQATTITNNANPLTIATGGTALNITGLTAGITTDSIVTINTTTGKINRINISALNKMDSTTSNNGLTLSGKNVQLGGNLTQATTITTSATNTLALTGLQTGSSTDSILVTSPGGIIKKIIAPASLTTFPQILVDARRTTTYTFPTTGFSTLIYNTANINLLGTYNASTGMFTAPATGIYQIMINNGYSLQGRSSIINQIAINSIVDMQYDLANSGNGGSSIVVTSIYANTIVNMTAGQTASITIGGLQGTLSPLPAPAFGPGQHVLKIIRLQ